MTAKSPKRIKPKVNLWSILSDAVESGVRYGYHRAYKHTDTPTEEQFIQTLDDAIMNALSEVLVFEDECPNCGEPKE